MRPRIASSPPVALTIAGSDCSAGAGVQADLKTFSCYGVFGLTAVTCVVAEMPGTVEAVHPVDPAVVTAQIRLLLDHYPVRAIKTGMLHSARTVAATAAALRAWRSRGATAPLVVDPVMIASSGTPLLEPDAVALYVDELIPMATLLTPNLDEASMLLGQPIRDRADLKAAATALAAQFEVPILLKGGHLRDDVALDLLAWKGRLDEYAAPYDPTVEPHGTGCTYAAAIAAGLAHGWPLDDAVRRAKGFITRAIVQRHEWHDDRRAIVALDQTSPVLPHALGG